MKFLDASQHMRFHRVDLKQGHPFSVGRSAYRAATLRPALSEYSRASC
jgi:hypothetical protein